MKNNTKRILAAAALTIAAGILSQSPALAVPTQNGTVSENTSAPVVGVLDLSAKNSSAGAYTGFLLGEEADKIQKAIEGAIASGQIKAKDSEEFSSLTQNADSTATQVQEKDPSAGATATDAANTAKEFFVKNLDVDANGKDDVLYVSGPVGLKDPKTGAWRNKYTIIMAWAMDERSVNGTYSLILNAASKAAAGAGACDEVKFILPPKGEKNDVPLSLSQSSDGSASSTSIPGMSSMFIDEKSGIRYTLSSDTKGITATVSGIATNKTKAVIPASLERYGQTIKVTAIKDGAFMYNTSLKSVTIGANVKKIGTMAFYGCKKLKTVKVQSTSLKKPGKSAFVDISPKAKITLP
ncbi:MAG: leucine-rich repeat domain-containing protein, partial [Lachnospiraceae bacterium]|nr:leucine-rich repeat domain-containing protein [Lachnospiraceae bacterium]